MTEWHRAPQPCLEEAIKVFKATLPGWWYSVCECQVSCDASCAPTRESPDIALIGRDLRFNEGFHVDLTQPATLAQALLAAMDEAIAARAEANAPIQS